MDSAGRPPKRRTGHTDFKPLSPGSYPRHTGKASEREAMAEGHGVSLMPESRGGRLGKPQARNGPVGRDVRVAAAALAMKGKNYGGR